MGSPKRSDPTVLETIFASPVVVGAARVPFEAHLAEEGEDKVEVAVILRELYTDLLEKNEILTAKLEAADRQRRELG